MDKEFKLLGRLRTGPRRGVVVSYILGYTFSAYPPTDNNAGGGSKDWLDMAILYRIHAPF